MKKLINAKSFKKFIRDLSLKKSFRISAFFIGIIAVIFGGITICKLIFDTNTGDYWDGTIATSFHSGSGTEDDPYIIATASEFAYLQQGCRNGVYIELSNDIYLNEGYIEYEDENYTISIGNKIYDLNPSTGEYYEGSIRKGQLVRLITSEEGLSCHLDGQDHKVFGVYVSGRDTVSLFPGMANGSIANLYVQSGLINGLSAAFVSEINFSSMDNVYFDGVISSGLNTFGETNLYNIVKNQSIGSSSTINYNVSSDYAENNYTSSSGYAYQAGVYQLSGDNNIYFYRGSVENNFVSFGGFCWRILRTTNAGGVKLIYDGKDCTTSQKGHKKSIGHEYDSINNLPSVPGVETKYTYEYNNIHYESNAKTYMDKWFENNLIDYIDYIEDEPYCNDNRVVSYDSTKIGEDDYTGNIWYRSSYDSSLYSINTKADLSCSSQDSYTVSSSNGNGKLTYPVGLITSDEAILSGMTSEYSSYNTSKSSDQLKCENCYLTTGQVFSTMTPVFYCAEENFGISSIIWGDGTITNNGTKSDIRPVITIKADILVTSGNGSMYSPYKLNIEEENPTIYQEVQRSSIGTSENINFNVSADYAENNYENSSYTNASGVFQLKEDENVYFYRGNVHNNFVLFGGFCWKILRTTSDNGVRLIYNGIPNGGHCGTTYGDNTTIGQSTFGKDYNTPLNEGKYSDIYNGVTYDSRIKTAVDNWYQNYMLAYSSYIIDSQYCNDTTIVSYDTSKIGSTNNSSQDWWYASSYRSSNYSINVQPTTDCATSDSYTVSNSNGNGRLTYPVGLITADEIMLSGYTSGYTSNGVAKSDAKTKCRYCYLSGVDRLISMTPTIYTHEDGTLMVGISSSYKAAPFAGGTTDNRIKPVITISGDIKILSGEGKATLPYILNVPEKLYDTVKTQKIGDSSELNYNESAYYSDNISGVYQLEEDNNIYFYRGNTDNYVNFAGYCWRIIRTTSTGGTRMIYNGPLNEYGQCNSDSSKIIGSSKFNSSTSSTKYGGYTYTSSGSTKSSTIKTAVDTWYANNLTPYTSMLEDSPYCNEMTTMTYSNTKIGTSNSSGTTWYSAAGRSSQYSINVEPSLSCSASSSYTVSSSNGNGKLTYPVGLITTDELALAGKTSLYSAYNTQKTSSVYTDTSNYLNSNDNYWTMTPIRYYSSKCYNGYVNGTSYISTSNVTTSMGIRPVITLKNDSYISGGSGSYMSPYVIDTTDIELLEETEINLVEYIENSLGTDSNLVLDTENNGKQNYRYVGENPNNYVCLGGTTSNCSDGELYRMIGVFGDDVHGQTGKQLVKMVRADSLDAHTYYDYKGRNVGSRGNTSQFSSDWSDSQLMYMLNGTHYVNSGYKIGGTTPIHNWTNNNGNISDGRTTFYTVNGSYYDGGGTVNLPKSVSSGSTYSATTATIPGLNAAARELVQEAKWNTALVSYSIGKTPAIMYETEQGASGYTNRPDYWIGKIGLISLSDFAYSTGGYNNVSRSQCLSYYDPDDYCDAWCDVGSWLDFDEEFSYYFITPADGIWDEEGYETVWGYESDMTGELWYMSGTEFSNTDYWYYTSPALYVKQNTVITSGSGTSSSPYMLSLATEENTPTSESMSSFIGGTYYTTISNIKIEGTIVSDGFASGLVSYMGAESSINNFEINADLYGNEVSPIYSEGYSYANVDTISYGYFNGNIYSNTVTITDSGDQINYNNVYILGNRVSNLEYSCAETGTNRILHNISSSNACYTSESSMITTMNSEFDSTYWKIESDKLPELLISLDEVNPVATVQLIDMTDNQVKTTYNGIITNITARQFNGNIKLKINSISDNTAIKQVQYLITNSPIASVGDQNFNDLSGDLTISNRGIFIVYFRITDINNNVTYINTDYLVNIEFSRTTINGGTGASLSNSSVLTKKDTIIDTYDISNLPYGHDKLSIKVTSLPAGTVISFMQDANLFQYTTTGSESYIPLIWFTRAGTNSNTHFAGSAELPLILNYDFSNTNGGTFNVNLVMRQNNVDIVTSKSNNINPTIGTSDSNTITLTNSMETKNISNITSIDISYNATATNTNGYYYMKFAILKYNNAVINASTIQGLSITYNGKKYYADTEGFIIVPIGTFSSTISLKLNIEKRNSTLSPGIYYIGASLSNELGSSSYSKFSITTNYMTTEIIEQNLQVIENTQTQVLNRETNNMTVSFNIKTNLEDTLYAAKGITTKIALYKKETLDSNTYSIVNINNYLTSSNQLSNGYNNIYLFGSTIYNNSNNAHNLVFNKNNMTPGAYRLQIIFYINSYEVKNEYVYFIVK